MKYSLKHNLKEFVSWWRALEKYYWNKLMCLILWVAARYRPDMKFFIKITTLKKNNKKKKLRPSCLGIHIYTSRTVCELSWSLHHGDQTRYHMCDRKTSSDTWLASHNNGVPMMPDILAADCFPHDLFVAILSYHTSEHSCSWWSPARHAVPPRATEGLQWGAAGSLAF